MTDVDRTLFSADKLINADMVSLREDRMSLTSGSNSRGTRAFVPACTDPLVLSNLLDNLETSVMSFSILLGDREGFCSQTTLGEWEDLRRQRPGSNPVPLGEWEDLWSQQTRGRGRGEGEIADKSDSYQQTGEGLWSQQTRGKGRGEGDSRQRGYFGYPGIYWISL